MDEVRIVHIATPFFRRRRGLVAGTTVVNGTIGAILELAGAERNDSLHLL